MKTISNKTLKIKRLSKTSTSKKTKKQIKIHTYFTPSGKKITDQKIINRINKLRIPPNYENVLISTKKTSKLQAIGYDTKGRKQYIYHPDFIKENNNKKYEKYTILGKHINNIILDYNKILNQIQNKPYSKWEQPASNLAVILFLLNEALFRIGNHKYFQKYNSHGILTLQSKHITLEPKKKIVFIKFIGKKGVINEVTLTDTKHFNIFKALKGNNKNQFIFDFKNDGNVYTLKTEDVVKKLSEYHEDITPKMFRTWHTNCYFVQILKKNLDYLLETQKNNKVTAKFKKDVIKNICKEISIKLHNTPTVIKKSYLNDLLFDLFMNKTSKCIDLLKKAKKFSKGETLIFLEEEIRK